MKKTLVTLLSTVIFAAFAVTSTVQAAEKKDEKKDASAEKSDRPIPFHGKLSAVDKSAKTVTLEGKEKTRTFHVTATTKIEKGGQAATLDDAKVGEDVGGSYTKTDDGKMELRKLRIGPKPDGEKTSEKKKKE